MNFYTILRDFCLEWKCKLLRAVGRPGSRADASKGVRGYPFM